MYLYPNQATITADTTDALRTAPAPVPAGPSERPEPRSSWYLDPASWFLYYGFVRRWFASLALHVVALLTPRALLTPIARPRPPPWYYLSLALSLPSTPRRTLLLPVTFAS